MFRQLNTKKDKKSQFHFHINRNVTAHHSTINESQLNCENVEKENIITTLFFYKNVENIS